jgi:hypothetical protein
MLISLAPKQGILQEAYIRMVVRQKEIIFKEINIRIIDPTKISTMVQKTRINLFK